MDGGEGDKDGVPTAEAATGLRRPILATKCCASARARLGCGGFLYQKLAAVVKLTLVGYPMFLALKGNQETLHQEVIDYIDEQAKNDFADVKARRHITQETGHGREEIRSYMQMPVPDDLRGLELWKGLKSIGMATLVCVRDGKETTEARYYISSLEVGVKLFAHAVRSHWGIESCHWSLDMIYREDESRIREPHMRENFACLNRFTLSLLKQHPGKDSIVMKRRACGWSEEFLAEVLAAVTL